MSEFEEGDILINKHGNEITILEDLGDSVRYLYKPLGCFIISKPIIERDWKRRINVS